MTLDETIKHCDELSKNICSVEEVHINCKDEPYYKTYECADQHEQLRDWLIDYKRLLGLNTPKKVKIRQAGYGDVIECPSCGESVQLFGTYRCKCCPQCGQKWSDSE